MMVTTSLKANLADFAFEDVAFLEEEALYPAEDGHWLALEDRVVEEQVVEEDQAEPSREVVDRHAQYVDGWVDPLPKVVRDRHRVDEQVDVDREEPGAGRLEERASSGQEDLVEEHEERQRDDDPAQLYPEGDLPDPEEVARVVGVEETRIGVVGVRLVDHPEVLDYRCPEHRARQEVSGPLLAIHLDPCVSDDERDDDGAQLSADWDVPGSIGYTVPSEAEWPRLETLRASWLKLRFRR